MNKLIAIIVFLSLSISLSGQNTISGTVVDNGGAPLIGATVLESGTSNGVITDFDGQYSITVSSGSEQLEVSYIGYETKYVPIADGTDYNILLVTSSTTLDEMVIIGYGATSKRFLTDNVAKLTADDIADVPVPNFQTTLSGKAAGVRVTQTNGKVEAGITFRIRGSSSLSAGRQPLYVLDGVPLINANESNNGAPTNPLLSLSPTEIESIDILKDASSAAIYGARGANGVVLITTKRGKVGQSKVSLNISAGVSKPTNLVEFLNAKQYVELFTEAAENGTRPDGFLQTRFNRYSNDTDWANAEIDTDWSQEAFKSGGHRDIDLSMSGGDKRTTYFIGAAYNDTKGIILGNNLDRISARTNLKHNFSEKFAAGMNLGYSITSIDRVRHDGSFNTPLQSIAQAPISPARLEDGTPFTGTVYRNFLLTEDYGSYLTKLRRVTGKAFAEYKILPSLKFNSDLGYDLSYQTEDWWQGSLTVAGSSTNGRATSSSTMQESYVFSNYLTYDKSLSLHHNLNVVLGTEFTEANRHFTEVQGTEFPTDNLQTINSAAEIISGSGGLTRYNFLSYFSRATYVYDDKYFLKGSIRRDGSSRFGRNKRFGIFPAISAGWIVSEEDFMSQNSPLSFLKLRVSYGELGNSNIGNFPARFLFSGISYNERPGLRPSQVGNQDLTWETSKQFDIGLEYGLLNDRLSGEIDFYKKNTNGLLFDVPLPGSSGFGSITRNIGQLKSQGLEFLLNIDVLKQNNLKWTSSMNFSTLKNEIVSLPNDNADIISGRNITRVGEVQSAFFMPEYAGVDPENGDALYYVNTEDAETGATTNNYSEAERVVLGNPFPDFTFGITNEVTYKNIELSFTFMGEFGATIYNAAGRFQSANGDWFDNQTVDQLNRWQNPGDITVVPQARLDAGNGVGHSSRWLESADFIRLRNLTLSYSIPNKIIEPIGFSGIRAYITGVNLLTITDYTGYDPESRSDRGGDNTGVAFYSSPSAKTISAGLNINF